jgi:hypothetical protein
MTAEDYRAMADECFRWVHGARTVDERNAYLNLARAWLLAASDFEDPESPVLPPAPRLPRVLGVRAPN